MAGIKTRARSATLLVDLRPSWLHCGGADVLARDPATGELGPTERRERIGVAFDCPCMCGRRIAVRIANPPDGDGPHGPPPLWDHDGAGFDSLTLTPSIRTPCWHGWIIDGKVERP